jgi:hypothetical protein
MVNRAPTWQRSPKAKPGRKGLCPAQYRIEESVRAAVAARINPLRWIKDGPTPLEEVLKTRTERATKFNVEKIDRQDLGGAAGSPDDGV